LRLTGGMRESDATEPQIAAIAGRQGGVTAIAQLLDAGLDHNAIARRVKAGRLHLLFRGVYAVGHRHLGVSGRRWAAVLACGPSAALSHASAGTAWVISRAGGDLDVLVPLGGRTAPPGIRLHRTRSIAPDELTRLHGLAITTPARTLLDLAATLTTKRLSTAISRAEQHRLLDFDDLHRLLARHPRRPGTPTLRTVLASYSGPARHPQRPRRPHRRTRPRTTAAQRASSTAPSATSPGPDSASSSKPTPTAGTAPPPHSTTTANATSPSPSPAGPPCASPTRRSPSAPATSPQRSAQRSARPRRGPASRRAPPAARPPGRRRAPRTPRRP
jgi:hypothetical protein